MHFRLLKIKFHLQILRTLSLKTFAILSVIAGVYLPSHESSTAMAVFHFSIYRTVVSVGGLAIFLILGSCLLISYPIGPTLHGYFYDVNTLQNFDLLTRVDQISGQPHQKNSHIFVDVNDRNTQFTSNSQVSKNIPSDESELEAQKNPSTPVILSETKEMKDNEGSDFTSSYNVVDNGVGDVALLSLMNDSNSIKNISDVKPDMVPNASTGDASTDAGSRDSGCDLFHGRWVHDSAGPLYTNNSCPVLTQMQNCQGNGRPDKDYENWRWKPFQCDLPRFDAKKFLELMRGKTLAFVGDSVARNQMESLLCILWQVEVPKNRGNKKMQKYHFSSASVSIVRIWSSWLVKQTNDPLSFASDGVTKLHLDAPDEVFMEFAPRFDVIVLSSGHWFAKQSVYVLNNEIVGGQLWWPDKSRHMKVNNIDAFGISVETCLTALGAHRDYTGLTIVRTYSPDHYEGGEWNTGGSCTGKQRPLKNGERVENGFTKIMHEKQVSGFLNASKKITNKSKLRLMDITEAFEYRHDGHPGPYRSTDPNKITKRGPDGRPPPQDCLHWCMPGPVDTWNEMTLEIIRREFEDGQNISS